MGEIQRRDEQEPHEFRRLRAAGWQRIVDGVVVDPAWELTKIERHRLKVDAVARRLDPGALVSHQSAVVVYDLPVWDAPLGVAHFTKNQTTGGRRSRDLVLHTVPITGPVAVVGSLLVTTPARTIIDCALTLEYERAVVIGDAAVRKFGVTRSELDRELELAKHRKGIAAARRVVAFLDGHSESPGESRSRIALVRNNISGYIPQGEVFADSGKFLGRADFYHEELPILGEFDGDLKYEGPDGSVALLAEKAREDLLRSHGNEMVRWGWKHLHGPALRDKFARARGRVGTGRARSCIIRQARLPKAKPLRLVASADSWTCAKFTGMDP